MTLAEAGFDQGNDLRFKGEIITEDNKVYPTRSTTNFLKRKKKY